MTEKLMRDVVDGYVSVDVDKCVRPFESDAEQLFFKHVLPYLTHPIQNQVEVHTGPKLYRLDFLVGKTVFEIDGSNHNYKADIVRDRAILKTPHVCDIVRIPAILVYRFQWEMFFVLTKWCGSMFNKRGHVHEKRMQVWSECSVVFMKHTAIIDWLWSFCFMKKHDLKWSEDTGAGNPIA